MRTPRPYRAPAGRRHARPSTLLKPRRNRCEEGPGRRSPASGSTNRAGWLPVRDGDLGPDGRERAGSRREPTGPRGPWLGLWLVRGDLPGPRASSGAVTLGASCHRETKIPHFPVDPCWRLCWTARGPILGPCRKWDGPGRSSSRRIKRSGLEKEGTLLLPPHTPHLSPPPPLSAFPPHLLPNTSTGLAEGGFVDPLNENLPRSL